MTRTKQGRNPILPQNGGRPQRTTRGSFTRHMEYHRETQRILDLCSPLRSTEAGVARARFPEREWHASCTGCANTKLHRTRNDRRSQTLTDTDADTDARHRHRHSRSRTKADIPSRVHTTIVVTPNTHACTQKASTQKNREDRQRKRDRERRRERE